jgi:hypothetical protein
VDDDIVRRLRHWANGADEQGVQDVVDGLNLAADEIERLRRNTGCARNQGTTQFCAELVTKTDELAKVITERDEARLLYCFRCSEDEAVARDMAKAMGWNCFKDIAGSSSTAPTPANTGGGADHQIPEAL